jgi:peptidoglycan/xylan/chitin deacetylase (PgdA/CDA1 family)
MQLRNAALLEAIFALKGNLSYGLAPPRRAESGVEIAPFKDGAASAACISADFEMGWGWRSLGPDGAERMGRLERDQVPMILRLLDEYSIPITWATIGHLFLESCIRSASGLAHEAMPRPVSDGTWSGNWYAADPCSNVTEAPAWYAPDLVQQIIDSRVSHELGTHSFSHINCQAEYSAPDVMQMELGACIDAMRPFGVKPRTFIFPRHQAEYSYLELMAASGITVVRHRDQRIRLSYPERTASGVYRIYESMNLRIAKHYDYLDKVKLFLATAQERHAAYALWFHPSDPIEWFDPQLKAILEYMATERDQNRLWVTTMHELAAYCEAREQVALTVTRRPNALSVALESSLDTARFGTPVITLLLPSGPEASASWQPRGLPPTRLPLLPTVDGSLRTRVNVPAECGTLNVFG